MSDFCYFYLFLLHKIVTLHRKCNKDLAAESKRETIVKISQHIPNLSLRL